jgi:hypothetical protein
MQRRSEKFWRRWHRCSRSEEHRQQIGRNDALLDLANSVGALLLIADNDFGELVFRQQRLALGVILLRLAGTTPVELADAVREHAEEYSGAFAQGSEDTRRATTRLWADTDSLGYAGGAKGAIIHSCLCRVPPATPPGA